MRARPACSDDVRPRSGRAERCARRLRASCDLADLHLDRGQPKLAAKAFEQARHWSADTAIGTRALIGTGRALLERGRLPEAEASFRTALLGEGHDAENPAARRWLALDLFLRGRFDGAEEALRRARLRHCSRAFAG
jgi:tetratricopeptide (TPR) repeat protein